MFSKQLNGKSQFVIICFLSSTLLFGKMDPLEINYTPGQIDSYNLNGQWDFLPVEKISTSELNTAAQKLIEIIHNDQYKWHSIAVPKFFVSNYLAGWSKLRNCYRKVSIQ